MQRIWGKWRLHWVGGGWRAIVAGAAMLLLCQPGMVHGQDANDLHIDGTLAMTDQIPLINIVLRRSAGGAVLPDPGDDLVVECYFDTGTSGMVIARQTRDILEIEAEPNAQYADVGVGGIELFEVSEPLHISTAPYQLGEVPEISDFQDDYGPWRLQLKIDDGDSILDIVGIPIMAGKVVVLKTSYFIDFDNFNNFAALLCEPNDPSIPQTDFQVKVRYIDYLTPSDPNNYGPQPILGYNPVFENVQISYQGNESSSDWLFDTGAQISMISPRQAHRLGLTEPNGYPIVEPNFYFNIGGIGGEQGSPFYRINYLSVPTLNGYNLVYDNPYVAVADIRMLDERTGQEIILDGVFGNNLVEYSIDPNDIWGDWADGAYDNLVLDTRRAILGFDLKSIYTAPPTQPNQCGDEQHPWLEGDINRDCTTELDDVFAFSDEWLSNDCDWLNWYCAGCDVDKNGTVDLADLGYLCQNWLTATWP